MKVNKTKVNLAMANACMNIDDLANVSNISRISIGKFLSGKTNPRPKTIGKIAKALGVKVEDLMELDAAISNYQSRD